MRVMLWAHKYILSFVFQKLSIIYNYMKHNFNM